MGLGRFGGGLGVTRWLAQRGATVLVTDLADEQRLAGPLEDLRPLIDAGAVSLALGRHDERDLDGADLLVANPAVPTPWRDHFLNAARACGIPITTEIRLAVEHLPRRQDVIGVTGSAGKSTTAAMAAHVLRAAGARPILAGNIGGSMLDHLDDLSPGRPIVLELSSAQLHWLGPEGARDDPAAQPWSPGVAAVTNITPNHLDWHGSIEHYRNAKLNILRAQRPGDRALLGDPALVDPLRGAAPPGVRIDCPGTAGREDLRLAIPGAHNRLNARLALALAAALIDRAPADLAPFLASFGGLPHRLEFVGASPAGVRVYNDSKSTTPEAAALAVAAFDEPGEIGAPRVRLICGGYDKDIDLGPMIDAAARCASVHTIGATAQAITHAVAAAGGRVEHAAILDSAVRSAADSARPGDVVLLSPGCASWDQFEHYAARGGRFAELARQIIIEKNDYSGPPR